MVGWLAITKSGADVGQMTGEWQQARETFRHGNVPDALLQAALERLEADGEVSLNLRELARDVGINHRAVYRHFPDKLSLIARVAEEGWHLMARRIRGQLASAGAGEDRLVAAGTGLFLFAREHPRLFELMSGPKINAANRFPKLEEAMAEPLNLFAQGFLELGTAPDIVVARTAVYVAALQGVVTQILHKRFHFAARNAKNNFGEICKLLIKGLR